MSKIKPIANINIAKQPLKKSQEQVVKTFSDEVMPKVNFIVDSTMEEEGSLILRDINGKILRVLKIIFPR